MKQTKKSHLKKGTNLFKAELHRRTSVDMTIKMLRQICSRWDFQATALGFPGFTEQSESKCLWGL